MTPETLARLKAEHLQDVAPLFTEKGLWVNALTYFAFGRKPSG
jgi:hypothetical protein